MTTQTYKMLEANWRKIANAAKGIPALGFKTSALIAANSVKTSATRARNSLGTPTSPVQAIGHQESIFIDDDSKTIFSLFSNAQLEVAFVADDVVRIDWRPGTEPVQYATSPFPEWRVGTWSSSLSHQQACISTSKASVAVFHDGTIRVSLVPDSGVTLWESRPPRRKGPAWLHSSPIKSNERFFGLGEQAASLNLRNNSFTLWNRDPGGSYGTGQDPLYMSIPVYMGLHEQGSYLVFHENSYRAKIEFRSRVEAEFSGGTLRTYLMVGEPSTLLERYTQLTGRPPLPSKWALGYHQSRWGYASETEIDQLAAGFKDLDIPVSAIHLDLDYMDGFKVFTIDEAKFPDMVGLSSRLGDSNIHLVSIVDCGVKVDESYPLYVEGLGQERFCKLPDGTTSLGIVWPGVCAFPDFTDPLVRDWWGLKYALLLDSGISGIWHDMNEPTSLAVWGDRSLAAETVHDMDGRGGNHQEAHNQYAICQNRSAFEALSKLRPDRRPFILSRSGWAGIQRHSWHWTADIDTSWDGFRQQIPTLLGLGLSGVAFTGSDIGGFSSSPSAELYLRWLQAGVFMPFCRTHSSVSTARREPWSFGTETQAMIRASILMRYKLLPYLYTLSHHTSMTGHPLMRPLWWAEPNDPDLWDVDDSFLLGSDLLVAPVFEEGSISRMVRLPRGQWYDLNEELQGGQPDFEEATLGGGRVAGVSTPLHITPVLVRAGCVLPLAIDPSAQIDEAGLELHFFLDGNAAASGTCFNDAGDGYSISRLDSFKAEHLNNRIVISHQVEGSFAPPYTECDIVIHGQTCSSAECDGKQLVIESSSRRLRAPVNFSKIEIAT